MWQIARRVLFRFDAETAHHMTMSLLGWWSIILDRFFLIRPPEVEPFEWQGMRYANRLGLAAGLDKGNVVVPAWFKLGFGFVEIGTITPRPQVGNPKPRLFRLVADRAIINRMGFNNAGAAEVAKRLRALRQRPGPIWLNIGKNKDTPNERAADDYESALTTLFDVADVFVINISSPNTPGLRDLQSEAVLAPLLARVMQTNQALAVAKQTSPRPVLLKLAPDLTKEALQSAVHVAAEAGLAGIIATNTTLSRPVDSPLAEQAGGLSGAPLLALANQALTTVVEANSQRMLVVGVGGITCGADAVRKRELGAGLVQIYSGFIFAGPRLIQDILALWRRR